MISRIARRMSAIVATYQRVAFAFSSPGNENDVSVAEENVRTRETVASRACLQMIRRSTS
jgi:hypothetical protein